jgi:putrescine transport system substrate-binding protein
MRAQPVPKAHFQRGRRALLALFVGVVLASCGRAPQSSGAAGGTEEPALNLYIWNDYLAPDTIANFEKQTGIKVAVSNYGSNEELESKLAPGNSGYDVVVPSAAFYERQIRSGYYRKLDKALLPNLKNMDPAIERQLAAHDPGNQYAVLHMWGTTGIGYNVQQVQRVMPDAPRDSWRMVFDPSVARNFKQCGIAVLDSASEMFKMVLIYLGKNPNRQNPDDLRAAAATMAGFRPYLRYVDTQRMVSDLANGEICLAVGYSGDILQARDRARENHTGQEIAYVIPREGTLIWFDSYLIPADAPHPHNAERFINYMLEPQVIAAVSNTTNYANGNLAAAPYMKPEVLNDPNVYPAPEVRTKLVPDLADNQLTTRLITRMWTRFLTGR